VLKYKCATQNYIPEILGSHGNDYEDVFRDVVQCSLAKIGRHFIIVITAALSTSETLLNFYEATGRNIPEQLSSLSD
jgi:hypothetical protein